jgi:hypothetical protein
MPKSSGKWFSADSTGYGVMPPMAHSEPSSMVSHRSSSSGEVPLPRDAGDHAVDDLDAARRADAARACICRRIRRRRIPSRSAPCWAMSTVSSNTTMPPWPIIAPAGGIGLVVERQSKPAIPAHRRRAGRRPARRGSAARWRAAAVVVQQFAQGDAEGLLDQPAALAGCRPAGRAGCRASGPCRSRGRRRRPGQDDGTLARVITLLITVGLPNRPCNAPAAAAWRAPCRACPRGFPAARFLRRRCRRRRPGALPARRPGRSRHVGAQQPASRGRAGSPPSAWPGMGVFGAQVDVALRRTHREPAMIMPSIRQ